jgi:hypothetical protein
MRIVYGSIRAAGRNPAAANWPKIFFRRQRVTSWPDAAARV